MKDTFHKFFPLVKVDEANHIVYGLVTAERRDKDGETCHYDSTKVEYQKVNEELGKASDGQNIMPLREMHQLSAVGAGKAIKFDDPGKQILMSFEVVDDSTWKKVQKKVLLGFSQGGRYLKRWTEGETNFYTAQPGEVSLVDNPCLPGALIEYAKADGGVEFYRAPGELSDEDISRLSRGVISELSTQIENIRALFRTLEDSSAATGDAMKPEQIKKCAEALGITEEEFKALITPLAKAHSMAALHGHLEKLHGHLTSHHEQHIAHVEKCMKACKGMMGSEEEAEKALATLNEELAKMATPEKKEAPADMITKADAQKMVDDAVAKAVKEALDKLPKNDEADKARLTPVPRNGSQTVSKVDSPYPGVV